MSDDVLRRLYDKQHKPPEPGKARCVQVEGGVVMHPDDLRADMSRVPRWRKRREGAR